MSSTSASLSPAKPPAAPVADAATPTPAPVPSPPSPPPAPPVPAPPPALPAFALLFFTAPPFFFPGLQNSSSSAFIFWFDVLDAMNIGVVPYLVRTNGSAAPARDSKMRAISK
jgi:hypothetical protein